MLKFFIGFHVIVCVLLISVILIQPGGRGNSATAFGGSGIESAFGGRAVNTTLTKATFVVGFFFMLTSLILSIASTSNKTVL